MGTCQLRRIRLDPAKVEALSIEQRFTYFFLGHAFNEIMSLQKLSAMVRPPETERTPISEGAIAMTTMIVRLLAGKVLEAVDRMNSDPVGPTLLRDYVEVVPDLKARIRLINRTMSRSKWYHALRRQTFHYPTVEDWAGCLEPDFAGGLYLYLGDIAGNSLFFGSEIVATASIMGTVNPSEPYDGLDILYDELGEAAKPLTELLQRCSVEYAREKLAGGEPEEAIKITNAPNLLDVSVPYFVCRPEPTEPK